MKKQLMAGLAIGSVLLAANSFAAEVTNDGTTAMVFASEAMGANVEIKLENVLKFKFDKAIAKNKGVDLTFTLPEGFIFKYVDANGAVSGGLADESAALKSGGMGENNVVITYIPKTSDLTAGDTLTFSARVTDVNGRLAMPMSSLKVTVDASDIDEWKEAEIEVAKSMPALGFAVAGPTIDAKLGPKGPVENAVFIDEPGLIKDGVALFPAKMVVAPGLKAADGTSFAYTKDDTVTFTVTSSNGFKGVNEKMFYLSPEEVEGATPEFTDGKDIAFTINGNTATAAVAANKINPANVEIVYALEGKTSVNPFKLFLGAKEEIKKSKYAAKVGITPTTFDLDINPILKADAKNGLTTFQAPIVQVPAGWLCRTVFTNTTVDPVDFTVDSIKEKDAAWSLKQTSGTIPAGGTLVNDCSDWVDMAASGNRGSLIFNLKASNADNELNAVYQIVNPASGSISNMSMVQTSK